MTTFEYEYIAASPLTPPVEDYLNMMKRWVKGNFEINEVPQAVLTAFEELEYAAQNLMEADQELRKAILKSQ